MKHYTFKEISSRPPNHNYDDLLQFFGRLGEPPDIFIRVPTIFMTYIDDPLPHSGATRAEISVDLDPQTGAQMVHYFNDPATTELGSLRAQNGHPEPYNIKYFMLGNEIWWPQADFGLSIDRVVNQTIAFAEAMKAADPTITIVFNPVNDSFPESFLRTSDPNWGPLIQKLRNFNAEVIPRTKKHIDAVQFFQYGLAVGDGTVLPPLDTEGWKSSMALNFIHNKYDNAGMHRNIADRYGPDVPMIMGEFSGPSARLGGAIYDADYMIYLLNNDYDIFVANWNSGLIEPLFYGLLNQDIFNNSPPIRRPNFYALKMFTNYFGDSIVETNISDPPLFNVQSFDSGEFLVYPAEQNVPASFSYPFEKHSVTVIFFQGITTGVGQVDNQTPNQFRLSQNYPNPFNPQTTIQYQLANDGRVTLSIYNLLGQSVRTLVNENQSAGSHSIVWDGKNDAGEVVTSGMYFYKLRTGDLLVATRKMLFLK